jgi:hypothetical protein
MENHLDALQSLLIDARQLAHSAEQDYSQKQWRTYGVFIQEFNRILQELQTIGVNVGMPQVHPLPEVMDHKYRGILIEQQKLREIVDASARLVARLETLLSSSITAQPDAMARMEAICNGFHTVARSLRKRHADRPTLDIADEYDVQDLLRSLLAVDFHDVRSEEWTPSYAGGTARMDFLLKSEKVVVETKMTRDGLSDKELGEQLIIDIARYSQHPDCKTLVCFVYDLLGRVANPAGLQADLEKQSSGSLAVHVIVRPS